MKPREVRHLLKDVGQKIRCAEETRNFSEARRLKEVFNSYWPYRCENVRQLPLLPTFRRGA